METEKADLQNHPKPESSKSEKNRVLGNPQPDGSCLDDNGGGIIYFYFHGRFIIRDQNNPGIS